MANMCLWENQFSEEKFENKLIKIPISNSVNPFLHIPVYSFEHIEEKSFKNEQFHLFPQCFLCNLYLKNFNSHISFVVCSCFEFGTISKWCIRNGLKQFLKD